MSIINYPDSIYHISNEYGEINATEDSYPGKFAKHGYLIGLRDGSKGQVSDILEGFSNLTQAIEDGRDIDWLKLDGRVAKCVSRFGVLEHILERDTEYDYDRPAGWYLAENIDVSWSNALNRGWKGLCGWTVYVEGDIPIKLPTADKLRPGSVFIGSGLNIPEQLFVLAYGAEGGEYIAYPVDSSPANRLYSSFLTVSEVKFGGFIDEEGH